jgi:hypothetical protein
VLRICFRADHLPSAAREHALEARVDHVDDLAIRTQAVEKFSNLAGAFLLCLNPLNVNFAIVSMKGSAAYSRIQRIERQSIFYAFPMSPRKGLRGHLSIGIGLHFRLLFIRAL